ncbi:hypothetical protein B0H14DRAFT_3740898 [Mycena olivaceomarginata]|nr:hypothetical protein B0H14DRAFT_3740898 [Mycena olivaceomarginata]
MFICVDLHKYIVNHIRWWGGWAEGEQVDTLMRYLLDSLQSYESGHGDALNPHRLEMDKSFMGDYEVLKAPTVGEFRTLSDKILTKLENFSTQIHCTHLHPAHGTQLPALWLKSSISSHRRTIIRIQLRKAMPPRSRFPEYQSRASVKMPWPGGVLLINENSVHFYSNRKLLAMEYRRLGSDDAVFMGTYPEHGNITQLLAAIRRNSGRTRSSCGYQLQ